MGEILRHLREGETDVRWWRVRDIVSVLSSRVSRRSGARAAQRGVLWGDMPTSQPPQGLKWGIMPICGGRDIVFGVFFLRNNIATGLRWQLMDE